MVLSIVFLALCCSSLADAQVPSYSPKCPQIDALSDYDEKTLPGTWLTVLSSKNDSYTCLTYHTFMIGDQQFHEYLKAKFYNGSVYSDEDYFRTTRPPNSTAKVFDVYQGFLYHMVMYILEYTPEMFIGYECIESDNEIEESVHVYARSLDYNKTHVELFLQQHNLSRFQMKDVFFDCPTYVTNF